MMQPGVSQVRTTAPDGTNARWLGALGHVDALNYGFTLPGGPDQMSCLLQREARFRSDALNPGRRVDVFRGSRSIWSGKLLEPAPGPDGWAIQANGAGNLGSDFVDIWSTWANVNDHVNQAIARGLPWKINGTLSNTGLWFGQQSDPGAESITDFLNLVTTNGGKVWKITVTPAGNVLTIVTLPTAVTRVLIAASPVARTLGGDVNSIYLRYQTGVDATQAATYSTVNVTTPASIADHGTQETYVDLSSAGVQTSGAITADGNNILARFQRASFAGPFAIRQGEWLNPGGQPIDIGCESGIGQVARVILTDYGYGGEIVPDPVQFLVGAWQYDDMAQTATVTPFQAVDLSVSGMLSALATTMPVHKPARKKKPRKPPPGTLISVHSRHRRRGHRMHPG